VYFQFQICRAAIWISAPRSLSDTATVHLCAGRLPTVKRNACLGDKFALHVNKIALTLTLVPAPTGPTFQTRSVFKESSCLRFDLCFELPLKFRWLLYRYRRGFHKPHLCQPHSHSQYTQFCACTLSSQEPP